MSLVWARQLVVTVSVEPDDPAMVGRTGSYRSLDGLARFHELCRRHGVRPTYLLTYSAAGEGRCVDLARSCTAALLAASESQADAGGTAGGQRDAGGTQAPEAEFGAHLHPEEVPPIARGEEGNHTLRPSEVEPGRLRAKLANLAERVAEATGRRPTSYRAGFFDLTAAQIAGLIELGFEADSSLGPLEKTRGGYTMLGIPIGPFLLDFTARGTALVEVPMTSVFRRRFPRALFGAYFAAPGPVRGTLRAVGLAELLRLRPAVATAEELLAVCRRTERLGVPAVMSIHSNELAAGTSAAVRTQSDSVAYFERLERVFAAARDQGWTCLTLTEVARKLRHNGSKGESPPQ